MQPSPENHEQQLERAIHQALHGLPLRPAPATLEQRVLAAIEQRAALSWWCKSYVDWPLSARCTFLIATGGIAKFAIMAAIWVWVSLESIPLREAFAPQFAWLRAFANLGSSILEFCAAVVQSIPPLWLYGGLACLALMYATLFGVGAFAYRTLHSRANSF